MSLRLSNWKIKHKKKHTHKVKEDKNDMGKFDVEGVKLLYQTTGI